MKSQVRNTVGLVANSPAEPSSGIPWSGPQSSDAGRFRSGRMRRWGLFTAGMAALLLIRTPDHQGSPSNGGANAAGEAGEGKKEAGGGRLVSVGASGADLQMLKTLERRKDEIGRREKEIQQQESRVQLARKELDKRLEELVRVRAEIQKLFETEEAEREQRLKIMTTTLFLNMRAEQSAQILSRMDPELVLKMMALVPEKQLTRILEKMDKDKAAQLSAGYLKQRRSLPKL